MEPASESAVSAGDTAGDDDWGAFSSTPNAGAQITDCSDSAIVVDGVSNVVVGDVDAVFSESVEKADEEVVSAEGDDEWGDFGGGVEPASESAVSAGDTAGDTAGDDDWGAFSSTPNAGAGHESSFGEGNWNAFDAKSEFQESVSADAQFGNDNNFFAVDFPQASVPNSGATGEDSTDDLGGIASAADDDWGEFNGEVDATSDLPLPPDSRDQDVSKSGSRASKVELAPKLHERYSYGILADIHDSVGKFCLLTCFCSFFYDTQSFK